MANMNLTGQSAECSSSSDANGANLTRPGFIFVAAGDWSFNENSHKKRQHNRLLLL